VKLTTTSIKTIALPDGKTDHTFFDEEVGGFGLRVRASGARSWILQYDFAGRTRRMKLGGVAELTAGKARDTAKDLLAAVRLGRDPAAEKVDARRQAADKAAETFGGELLRRYLTHKRASVRPRSFVEIERHLRGHAKSLHGRPVTIIKRRDIAAVVAKIAETSGPVAANRTLQSISAFFGWLAGEGILESNTAEYVNKAATNGPRSRVLTDPELIEIWRAAGELTGAAAAQFGIITRLLMLTGLRRNEIGLLRWSEIDLDRAVINLPIDRVKNARPHTVPLVPTVIEILRSQPRRGERDLLFGAERGPFGSYGPAKITLDERIRANRTSAGITGSIPSWTLHDFRRTISTRLNNDLGVQPHIVEAILGHTVKGIASVYNKAEYLNEQRRALERWAEYIDRLLTGKTATVTQLYAGDHHGRG
jgi:integrase